MVQNKYKKLIEELNGIMQNRSEEITALVLGHVSMTHLVMLGDPGTGKSYLVRKFAEAFPSDASSTIPFFEIGLNSFTKPEDVFGGIDIHRWKSTSELVYNSSNFLPNARIAFLDEMSRGEAVLNSLLTIVNERIFNVNGVAQKVPLEMAISATNFKFSSNEFEAMRDRFLQWLTPQKLDLHDEESMFKLWQSDDNQQITVRITEAELKQVRAEVNAVKFDEDTLKAFKTILIELKDNGILVSDRRSKAILKLVKASAWMDCRDVMNTADLECIWSALWSDENQISTVKKVIRKYVNPERQIIDDVFEGSQLLMQNWKTNPVATSASEVSRQLKQMKSQLKKIGTPKAANKQSFDMANFLLDKFQETIADVILQKAGTLGI